MLKRIEIKSARRQDGTELEQNPSDQGNDMNE